MSQLPNDLEELRRQYIELGGNPNTQQFFKGEQLARQKAQDEISRRERLIKQNQSQWHKAAARIIEGGLQAVAVFFTIFVVLIGTVVGTILLIVAEIAAVAKGFSIIDAAFAPLYAAAVVSFFLVIHFIREIVQRNSADEARRVFSMRYLAQYLWYFLGFGKVRGMGGDFKPRFNKRTPLLIQIDNAITWLMWTIILFGLLGRLYDALEGVPGNWRQQLSHIWNNSSLAEIGGYIGSFVMTIALLLGTSFIVYLSHLLFVQVTGGISLNFSQGFSADLVVEAEVVRYWQTKVLELQVKKTQLLEATNSDTQPSETTNNTD